MAEIKYEVKKHIGVIGTQPSGWQKELNLISWNGNEPKYDIREWAPDHSKMSKGITLTQEEADKLCELLGKEE